MPRSWFCSQLFWLGFVPLAFLLWGWWDSCNQYTRATVSKFDTYLQLATSRGTLELELERYTGPRTVPWGKNWDAQFVRLPNDDDEILDAGGVPKFSGAVWGHWLYRRYTWEEGPGAVHINTQIEVPVWLLAVCYAALFLFIASYLTHRKRRNAAGIEADLTEG